MGLAHFFFESASDDQPGADLIESVRIMVFRQKEIEEKVYEVVSSMMAQEGYELVAVEFIKSHEGPVLRMYMDKPGGVTIEDCSVMHKKIEAIMLGQVISDLQYRDYHLEVQSPGLNRILKKKEDFERFQGQQVQIFLSEPLDAVTNQRNYTGILKGLKQNQVMLEVSGDLIEIPWEFIKSANIKYEFRGR